MPQNNKVQHFDLVIIGSGPAGEKAAVKAAYFGKKVAMIEKSKNHKTNAVVTGTLPSKTLRETSIFFSGKEQEGIFGVEKKLDIKEGEDISANEFLHHSETVAGNESLRIRGNLEGHKIKVFQGLGRFVDDHCVEVIFQDGTTQILHGKYILIATGSFPVHPEYIPFEHPGVHDSESIIRMEKLPKTMCIVGGGVIGCEYTTIFSTKGVKVTLVNKSETLMGFLDHEVREELIASMKRDDVNVMLGYDLANIVPISNDLSSGALLVQFTNGEEIVVDQFLYAAGREGRSASLRLEKAGLEVGKRGTIAIKNVNCDYQTAVPHIYAVGDVVGFPSLASTSAEQGRVAVSQMFEVDGVSELTALFPYGIYTIPEISMVGITEEEAKKKNLPYATGIAHHTNSARGSILGTTHGFIKLIVHTQTQEILGVHIIGSLATELIHYGMIAIQKKSTLHDLTLTVFNYPTLHQMYKYAAYDAMGNMAGKKLKKS